MTIDNENKRIRYCSTMGCGEYQASATQTDMVGAEI